MSDKTALRARLRSLRRQLAVQRPEAARRAAALLPVERLPAFAAFSGYHAIGSEMDPGPLMERLAQTGAEPCLPVAVHRDQPLVFRIWSPGDPLAPDVFGIPSPGPEAEEVLPDVVFTPVLAFDARGGRLGQGAGHYDRTIANLRALKPVLVIGLAYSGQEVDQVPMEPHDQRLDAILTETGYVQFG